MENKKLKVVWLCYFSNQLVQDTLNPWKKVGEFAPWISSMIPLFENDSEVELHLISSQEWISGSKNFENNNVIYHFFNKGIPFSGRHWPGFFRFDLWSDFFVLKRRINQIIKKIQPDIIHLHGTENDFSASILQFKNKYPVFITIQGFIHKSSSITRAVVKRKINELQIMKLFRHFGYRTETMGEDIRSLNHEAILHWHRYPGKEIKPIKNEKKFDLVFFARISKDKGIEDLLQAVTMIKKEKPDISLCVIGSGNIEPFKKLALELEINNNVYWAGFQPKQEDVHMLAASARICVLPTYHDIISGTIVESLFLKLPVVAYNVGSIHEVNKHEDIISLVEKQDVKGLADSILLLLKNEELQKERAEKGYLRALEMFSTSNNEIRNDLLKAYKIVIEEFQKN